MSAGRYPLVSHITAEVSGFHFFVRKVASLLLLSPRAAGSHEISRKVGTTMWRQCAANRHTITSWDPSTLSVCKPHDTRSSAFRMIRLFYTMHTEFILLSTYLRFFHFYECLCFVLDFSAFLNVRLFPSMNTYRPSTLICPFICSCLQPIFIFGYLPFVRSTLWYFFLPLHFFPFLNNYFPFIYYPPLSSCSVPIFICG